MAANIMITILLFRILLPIIITICVIFRPSGLSAIYLFLLFYLPFVPLPNVTTMSGHSGIFLKILIVISVLTSLCQIAFQLLIVFLPQFLESASNLEKIMRHAGFVRLNHISPAAAVRWISPEVLMLITSVAFFIVIRKINSPDQLTVSSDDEMTGRSKTKQRYVNTLVAVGRFSVLALLCVAGVLRPSVLGGLYYLIFLSAATWWACYKQLTRGFAIVLSCLIPILFIHVGALYSYQFEWPQEFLDGNSTYARYFGLTQLILTPSNTTESSSNVTDPREFSYNENEEWVSFINPIFLYLLYYISIFEAKQLFDPELKKKQGTFSRLEGSFRGKLGRTMSQRLANKRLVRSTTPKRRWQSATRKVRLIRGVSPSKRTGSDRRSGVQGSTASESATGNTEDIPLDELEDDENYEPTLFDNVLYALESIVELIVRNSYIGTNIIMMAWSITYLSWLTFVLLIWANLIWLIPNQRKSMLRSSPLLVFYAWFLLLTSYIYSMNLTDDELPSTIDGYNLEEIGFQKIKNYPCENLFVKSLYTIMFWVTLRQFMQERTEKRQTSALADMVAPLQVTVGTATGVNREQEKTGSRVMEVIGTYIKKFLTRFWIWIVAITLFAVAITGERMTGFRILYMALFLFFLITFQLSFNLWRKIMFGFWLTVIIYSMIILVLVYTYQFKDFPSYWTNYLHIPQKIQLDIGLEQFATKQLFVRLFIPTFFVIITVIQLHYFHVDFMIISDPKNTNANIRPIEVVEDLEQSSMQGGAELDQSIKEETSSSVQFDIYALGYMSSDKFQNLAKRGLNKLHRIINLIFLFLEIHMLKIVLFLAMMVCIYDKCAIYIIVVIMLCLGLTCGRPMQMLAVYSTSILVSILLLARMIYQIQYITPMEWNVTCQLKEDSQHNETITNNAPWLGFRKTDEANRSLASLVKWNIIYIIVATLWSVILVRQYNYRASRGRPTTRAFFMFPNITRNHADKDLGHCLKYLFNYGFYKFGVEICLVIIVILIGVRMDLYALLHATWLVILFLMNRKTKDKIWLFYVFFTAVTIPFQYFMTVGLPPSLCQEFPWDDEGDKRWANFRDWAYLLDFYYPPPERKLICDFILLLAISRQWVVFRIEKRYAGKNYAGGSNDRIIHLAEDTNFKNPVPDFITYVRSYLDIFKKCLLQSFLWITLALVFLAGTNRVNIFSVGYLLGAFVFLWHGSDLYLRPIPKILKQWHLLIGYNVVVIFLKASFQIVGCVFSQDLPEKLQGLVQMIGIGCVRKFACADPLLVVEKTEYTGIAWDAVCFGFLIIQSRIFKSFNFFHIIDDTKATTILASRGAELMEQMEQKTAKEQEEEERQILEKIKLKMDRIKASQQKIQDSVYKSRPKYRKKAPVTYKQAIRSGDYYMFDELEDDDLDLLIHEKPRDEDEEFERQSIGQLLSTAMKTDIDTALRNQSQLGLVRQYSMPLSRQKSARSQLSAAFSAPPTIEENEPRSVRIQEVPEREDQPGTSTGKDEDFSEFEDYPKESVGRKILKVLVFIWAFIESSMVSLTNFLNKYSRNYRYIVRVLRKEKKLLKERTNYSIGVRIGPSQVWHPAGSYATILQQSMKSTESQMVPHDIDYSEEMSSRDQPTIFRLVLAIWYIIMSRSEFMCFFVIFLNQIKTATFLSLPLPLMVFFWGALTIPRPTKTFWVTIIAYTEVIVLLKCMFQFDIMPGNVVRTKAEYIWSNTEMNVMYPSNMWGLYRQENYATWDLLLLLVVFFHRVLMKSMGIWSSSAPVPAALLADGEYKIENGDLVPLTSSSPKSDGRKSPTPSGKISPSTSRGRDSPEDKSSRKSHVSEDERIIIIQTRRMIPIDKLATAVKMTMARYAEAFRIFNQELLDPSSRVAVDVYFLMFFCDFFNFFVILFGYSSFGSQHDGGVKDYLEDNRVPPLFLFMLIFQFMLIIIDRGIYLQKNILAKVIFQYVQIVLLHAWMFALFPIITGGPCNRVIPPQIYYMVKCFYLLLSAYQIRSGYPTRILGNFLCKGYGYVNMVLFKAFMLVPFLFELRTCMDWMWTETSMTIFDWIKMEDIFQHIFLLKCNRYVEDEYPQPRGEKKKPLIKYLMGGGVLAVIIAIIWFPLVFFSLGNAVGQTNIPSDVTLEIRIGPYDPVYKMTAQSNSIFSFTEQELETFHSLYNGHKVSETFIYNYEAADIAAVKLSTDSANVWSVSPPDRNRMLAEVNSTKPLTVTLQYKVVHKTSKAEDSGIVQGTKAIELLHGSPDSPDGSARMGIHKMLLGEQADPVLFRYIFPKFLKITNRGTITPVEDLMVENPVKEASTFRNVTLKLQQANSSSFQEWWVVHEECDDYNYHTFLEYAPYKDCENSLILYTFNDKVFPPTLDIITGGGIIGLYTTLVFVASRVLRGFFADQCSKIMFDDMPYVDRVLQLCLDIYLVREASEFTLEEDLFAKLVFLFRSPETLIKWTRPKEELVDNDDPEGDAE